MNIFAKIIENIATMSLLCGVGIGLLAFYNRCPPAWFEDYLDNEKLYRSRKEQNSLVRTFQDKFLFVALFSLLSFVFFARSGYSVEFVAATASFAGFMMISAADIKTGIIPDQFTVATGFTSLLWIAADFDKTFELGGMWYRILAGKFAAGLICFGMFWFIRVVGGLLAKKEALGMGDVKLAFVAGLLSGLSGVVFVFMITFLTSALPVIIFKVKTLLKLIRSDKFPANSGKSSENEGRIALGPFISVSTYLYITFSSEFAHLAEKLFY